VLTVFIQKKLVNILIFIIRFINLQCNQEILLEKENLKRLLMEKEKLLEKSLSKNAELSKKIEELSKLPKEFTNRNKLLEIHNDMDVRQVKL